MATGFVRAGGWLGPADVGDRRQRELMAHLLGRVNLHRAIALQCVSHDTEAKRFIGFRTTQLVRSQDESRGGADRAFYFEMKICPSAMRKQIVTAEIAL